MDIEPSLRLFHIDADTKSALAAFAIISDFNMPEMDGLQFLQAVRAHPTARRTPFIMLTGRGDKELVSKAAQAGVNNYVIKPFTVEMLKKKIEAVVGKLE